MNKTLIVLGLMTGLIFWIGQSNWLELFSAQQQMTLLVLIVAIYLWTASPIPAGPASFLVLALMIGLGIVESSEMAFRGFLTEALYFILLLSLISQVLVKIGFDRTVAEWFQRVSRGRIKRLIVGLPLLLLLMPIILPSAMARYKILYPLISKINDLYGYSHQSLFKKFGLYVISFFNQKATLIIFTGGGFSVIAYQLMVEYGVGQLRWIEWFTLMAPPLWLAMLLSAAVVWVYLKWRTVEPVANVQHSEGKDVEADIEAKHHQYWLAVIAFGVMILTWILTDPSVFPIILPPMLLVVFYALPQVGLVNNQLIRSFDWESFLLLGTSFSLGMLMADNGTAQVIAEALVEFLPGHDQRVLIVISLVCFIWMMRFMFTNSSSAIAVVFPIFISYAELVNISPIALSLLVIMVIGGTLIIPIHSPSTFYASQEGIISRKEQFVIGFISSLIVSIVAVLAVFLYW
ncbi:SLC13 family permease [Tenuibacillus multivorans]|nr:anion permease [Tenuibacillus multivorans]